MPVCSLEAHKNGHPAYSITYPDRHFAFEGSYLAVGLIPVLTKVYESIHFEVLGTTLIQIQPVVAASAKVSREVSDGGTVHETWFLA